MLTTRVIAARPTGRSVSRRLSVSARATLVSIVGTSFLVRVVTAWPHSTARFFPDEYLYSSLARSISEGRLTIRGGSAHFPALLEPLLAAPMWLAADPELVYRMTQGLHALAFSLAAVPTFLLARCLHVSERRSLLAALAAVAIPAGVYSSYVTADALGYPLVITAVLLGVRALERPSLRRQAVFLSVAGLATFARIQYVVLVPVFLAASVVVGNGRPRAIVRGAGLVLCTVCVGALVATVVGQARITGYYSGTFSAGVDVGTVAHWMVVDAMFIALGSGVVLIPLAVAGLVRGLHPDAPEVERAFASLTVFLVIALLFESAFIVSGSTGRFYERYAIAAYALIPIAFCVGVRDLPRGRAIAAGVVAVLLLTVMLVPVSGFTVDYGKQDAPFLQSVYFLERHVGYGNGSILVALAASALALLALLAARRTWVPTALMAAAIAATGVMSAGAVLMDSWLSARVRETFIPGTPSWIDHSSVHSAALLVLPGDNAATMFDLFWNTKVDRLLLMPGAEPVDAFKHERVSVGRLGDIRIAGKSLDDAFVVRGNFAAVEIKGARRVASSANGTLWKGSRPHLRLLTIGRYSDGWMDAKAQVTAWPRRNGTDQAVLRIPLAAPASVPTTHVTVSVAGTTSTVTVPRGRILTLSVPLRFAGKPLRVLLRADRTTALGGRAVSVRAGRPTIVWRTS